MNGQLPQNPIAYSFQQLQPPPKVDQAAQKVIQQVLKNGKWQDIFECITLFRRFNKYNPQTTPGILNAYGEKVLDTFSCGKTQLVCNGLRWIAQIFMAGKAINMEKAVYLFVPYLLKKASLDKGNVKNYSQNALSQFAINCGYQISFRMIAEFSIDKNIHIMQTSLKLFKVLVMNCATNIVNLNGEILKIMMITLMSMIQGSRNNVKKQALDICINICQTIGSENYILLMNGTLKPEEVNKMGKQMEYHRVQKSKPLPLSQVIKERKTQLLNPNIIGVSQCQNVNNNNGQYGQCM